MKPLIHMFVLLLLGLMFSLGIASIVVTDFSFFGNPLNIFATVIILLLPAGPTLMNLMFPGLSEPTLLVGLNIVIYLLLTLAWFLKEYSESLKRKDSHE